VSGELVSSSHFTKKDSSSFPANIPRLYRSPRKWVTRRVTSCQVSRLLGSKVSQANPDSRLRRNMMKRRRTVTYRHCEVSTAPRAVAALASLVESRLLEPSALAVVSQLAAALADPGPARPVGMWGALKALRDPDVQRALGFLLAVARQFGKNLAAGEVEACRDRLDHAVPHQLEAP
jgi:hypothetical protein